MTHDNGDAAVQDMLKKLIEAHGTPQAVAGLLAGRASERSVYRWLSGDTIPQSVETRKFLRSLCAKVEKNQGEGKGKKGKKGKGNSASAEGEGAKDEVREAGQVDPQAGM